MDRDTILLELRPQIDLDLPETQPEEYFQNQTLRPILKLQHALIINLFENYLQEKSIHFHSLSAFQQRITIENAVKKDLPLRHTLIGCIVGHFTASEYAIYFTNRIAFHKRIITLLIGRLSHTLITPQV